MATSSFKKLEIRRRTLLWGALAQWITSPANAAENKEDATAFFREESTLSAHLSPDGQRVALRTIAKHGGVALSVLDLASMTPQVLHSQESVDACAVVWANTGRLLFSAEQRRTPQGLIDSGPGLYAINADGTLFRQLVERQELLRSNMGVVDSGYSGVKATGAPPKGVGAAAAGQEAMGFKQIADAPKVQNILSTASDDLQPWNTFLLATDIPSSMDGVVIAWRPVAGRQASIEVFQINSRTGRGKLLDLPANITSAHVDSAGDIRAIVMNDGPSSSVQWRDSNESVWRVLPNFTAEKEGDWGIKYIDASGTIYVSARRGKDKLALSSYEVRSALWSVAPLAQSPQFDVDATIIATRDKILGYRFTIDAEVTQWIDPELQSLQEQIDKVLPRTVNRLTVPRQGNAPWVMVEAFGDIQPALFFLFNRLTRKFTRLGSQRPDIDSKQMSSMDMVRVRARDGLDIPVWLTLPSGAEKKNLPVVMLVHGGPFEPSNTWHWRPEVQFLVSRGYAVVEPEFRGTKGFGIRHFKAGWLQFGKAIQSDVEDVTRWAIRQGIANAKRIAIVGSGFGGYVSLLALQRNSDLFRCAVVQGALTDLNLVFEDGWTNSSDDYKRYGPANLIGESKRDSANLRENSPLTNAASIRQPLLMVHGAKDIMVPVENADAYRKLVQPINPALEWLQYPNEGHELRSLPNIVNFYNRMAQFLDKHLAV